MKRESPANHLQDSDCSVNPQTQLCSYCGVLHGEPCVHCGARAYHRPGCLFLVRARSPRVLNLQRNAKESLRTRKDPPISAERLTTQQINDVTAWLERNNWKGVSKIEIYQLAHMLQLSPVAPFPPFVSVNRSVMRGAEHIATAVSTTMAHRIARALNQYQPNKRGF